MKDVDDDTASAGSNLSGMSVYSTGTRSSSLASVSVSATSKGRDSRRQRKKGRIRPGSGSAGEEMALVEHLKGISQTAGAKCELKSLLLALVMPRIIRKCKEAAENFQLSQIAAVRLTDDTVHNDCMDEKMHTLDYYMQKSKK